MLQQHRRKSGGAKSSGWTAGSDRLLTFSKEAVRPQNMMEKFYISSGPSSKTFLLRVPARIPE